MKKVIIALEAEIAARREWFECTCAHIMMVGDTMVAEQPCRHRKAYEVAKWEREKATELYILKSIYPGTKEARP